MAEQPFDITNFINLLEKNQKIMGGSSKQSRKNSVESNRLSIIYSASQPESSMPDKQNSQNSANKEINLFKSEDTISQLSVVLLELRNSGLSKWQNDQLDKAQILTLELMKNIEFYEKKIKFMENQFEEERKGTDEIMQALMKMDEAEKQLWGNFNDLMKKHEQLQTRHELKVQQNIELGNQNQKNEENIQFMRKLVLIANQNYQSLEKKYKQIEREIQMKERFRQQKSSPEITSRSTHCKKKSYSPTISERLTLSGKKKNEFEENYRRMILRTLKNKAQEK